MKFHRDLYVMHAAPKLDWKQIQKHLTHGNFVGNQNVAEIIKCKLFVFGVSVTQIQISFGTADSILSMNFKNNCSRWIKNANLSSE